MRRIIAERVNVNLPKPLLDDLRRYVPRSQRSEVIARATARELRRIKLLAALYELEREPAWRTSEHPELTNGTAIDHHFLQRRGGVSRARVSSSRKETARG